jgi:hypothetical protein
MKIKSGLLCMILFAVLVIAKGQAGMQRSTPEERSRKLVDTITTVLKLDQSQQSSAQITFMEYYKETDKIREAIQAGTPPDRSQFEKLTSDRDEKLRKFLSADQFKKFKDDIEPAMHARRQNGGGNS